MTYPASGQGTDKNFFASLFDFGFTTFVTLKFLKVIYGILVALIALFAVVFLVRGLSSGGGGAVLALIFVPLGALLYLILARVYMEILALFFRIGENTSQIARALAGGTGAGPAGGPAPGGPQGYGPPSGGYEQPYGGNAI